MTLPSEAKHQIMPAAFFGHGNPMNALQLNRYTSAWRAFGSAVPRPRAIVVISAHWYINATAVTVMPKPRTIHDLTMARSVQSACWTSPFLIPSTRAHRLSSAEDMICA